MPRRDPTANTAIRNILRDEARRRRVLLVRPEHRQASADEVRRLVAMVEGLQDLRCYGTV